MIKYNIKKCACIVQLKTVAVKLAILYKECEAHCNVLSTVYTHKHTCTRLLLSTWMSQRFAVLSLPKINTRNRFSLCADLLPGRRD